MIEQVFVDAQKKATFKCPECDNSWTKDLTKLKSHKKLVRLKCKCPCGHSFPILLGKRRHFRKNADLDGAFIHDKLKTRGLINIKNISKSGIGLKLSTDQFIHEGDRLEVRFNLDDPSKSYICKEVVVRKIEGNYLGVEFSDITREYDHLHSYLVEEKNEPVLSD